MTSDAAVLVIGGVCLANIAAIFSAYIAIVRESAKRGAQVDRLIVDVDNLAAIMKTRRAEAREKDTK